MKKYFPVFVLVFSLVGILFRASSTTAEQFDNHLFLPVVMGAGSSAELLTVKNHDNEMFIMNSQGQERIPVQLQDDETVMYTFWSPDRQQFVINSVTAEEVYDPVIDETVNEYDYYVNVVDASTGQLSNLATGPNWAGDWSEETGIAIHTCDDVLGQGLVTIDSDGSNPIMRRPNPTEIDCTVFDSGFGVLSYIFRHAYLNPQFLPDGTTILSWWEIIDEDGNADVIPFPDPDKYTSGNPYVTLTPSGEFYTAYTDVDREENSVLLRYDPESGTWEEKLRLTDKTIPTFKPSPDGRSIAIVASDLTQSYPPTPDSGISLIILDLNTLETQNLTPQNDATQIFDWSPDGSQIAISLYQSNAGDDYDFSALYIIDVDTGNQTKIDDNGATFISWAK